MVSISGPRKEQSSSTSVWARGTGVEEDKEEGRWEEQGE